MLGFHHDDLPESTDRQAIACRVSAMGEMTGSNNNSVTRRKKVLFVDDEPTLAALAVDLLDEAGYDVVCAGNGRQALELFQQHGGAFDLVVTDESMPQMSGIELAGRLYRLAPNLPVVLCSGYDLTRDEPGLDQTNVRSILAKTELFVELPKRLHKLLDPSSAEH